MTAAEWLRAVLVPERSWRDVLAYAELAPADRQDVQRRARAGMRSPDPDARALALRVSEDVVVAELDVLPCSPHLRLEVAVAAWRGRPLERGEPVPGCGCWRCTGRAPAPRHEPDTSAIVCPRCCTYRELVSTGRTVWYQCMDCGTRSASAWPCSAVGSMLDRLPRVPAARRRRPRRDLRPALDIDAARAVPILTVARMLGIETRRGWARCPFHDDSRPSFHVNASKNVAYCNPCARRWDPIALTMELRRITFADAVRELATLGLA